MERGDGEGSRREEQRGGMREEERGRGQEEERREEMGRVEERRAKIQYHDSF